MGIKLQAAHDHNNNQQAVRNDPLNIGMEKPDLTVFDILISGLDLVNFKSLLDRLAQPRPGIALLLQVSKLFTDRGSPVFFRNIT